MKKENIPLIIGIALPIILVILVALAIYIPRILANSQYDFVYVVDDVSYRSVSQREPKCTEYKVSDGKLVQEEIEVQYSEGSCLSDEAVWYKYDVSEGKSRVISVSTLETLSLDPSVTSPDGFRFTREYSHNGIFEIFGGTNRNEWILEKNNVRLRVNLYDGDYYYNVRFIGWIID